MYYNEDGNLLTLSYSTWLRECVKKRSAFIITPRDEIEDEEERLQMIYALEDLLDETDPERSFMKSFPVVKDLGHYLFSNDKAVATREEDPEHPLTREYLEELIADDNYIIQDAWERMDDSMLTLLSLPMGFTWDIRDCF